MRRLLAIAAIMAIAAQSGCGGGILFISTGDNGTGILAISGTVTIVNVTVIASGGGTQTTVTVVTFIGNGASTTMNFCGDISNQFPLNSFADVRYTQGTPCATVVSVN
jgi:hypothetical protein